MIKDGSPAGEIILRNFIIEENPNFADYLNAGWQLSLSVAIDFTASNLQIYDPRSHHFTYTKHPTPYAQCMEEVGTILAQYDPYKNFPLFGFGGIPTFMNLKEVSHCFPLNGSVQSPEVHGVKSMLELYKKQLAGIRFAGPTFFHELLGVF